MTSTLPTRASADELADTTTQLVALIRHHEPHIQDIEITGLRRTSGGFSRENWILDARWRSGTEEVTVPLVLRRDPPAMVLDTSRDTEFALLRALAATDVPAPGVYWLDDAGTWMGRPSVVMQRMTGDCDWMMLNSALPLPERLSLAQQFTDILGSIQRVDWKSLGLDTLLGAPDDHPARSLLDRWHAELGQVQLDPLPEMELVRAWLLRHLPDPRPPVLVHGDFKPGNVLFEGDRITAILDWETAHLGDPLEDLGWMTNPARRREQQIPGSWQTEDIVRRYSERTGQQVNSADLLWWHIFSCWRLAITNVSMVRGFVDGQLDRVNQTPTWLFRRMFQLIERG